MSRDSSVCGDTVPGPARPFATLLVSKISRMAQWLHSSLKSRTQVSSRARGDVAEASPRAVAGDFTVLKHYSGRWKRSITCILTSTKCLPTVGGSDPEHVGTGKKFYININAGQVSNAFPNHVRASFGLPDTGDLLSCAPLARLAIYPPPLPCDALLGCPAIQRTNSYRRRDSAASRCSPARLLVTRGNNPGSTSAHFWCQHPPRINQSARGRMRMRMQKIWRSQKHTKRPGGVAARIHTTSARTTGAKTGARGSAETSRIFTR